MAYIVTCIKRESTCEIQLGYDIAAGLSHQSEEEEQDHWEQVIVAVLLGQMQH